ncbi:hypothetical protein FRB90_010187 [Tulasnella sp. 427]|nr:hypothetical protein FRB90_010187 [Tulasnella sp. 427]
MGFRKEAQHFARYTHAIDFASPSSPETVDRLIRNSEGSSKSFTALAEMRRVREAALDGLIEALEPRKNFCAAHSASDGMFFAFVAMIKTAARNALLHPYPGTKLLGDDADAFEFLGVQGEDERRVVTWCSGCYARADRKRLTAQLSAAIEKYPQTIFILPDGDFWGEWS